MDDLTLCNLALGRLGETRVDLLGTGGGPLGVTLAALLPPLKKLELRRHRWNWAAKSVALTGVASTDPQWTHQFDLPGDFLAVDVVSAGADVAEPIDEWFVEREYIFADSPTLFLRYIFYQEFPDKWDALFLDAFTARLAARISETLRGSTSARAELSAEADRLFSEARRKDANEVGKRPLRRQATYVRDSFDIYG